MLNSFKSGMQWELRDPEYWRKINPAINKGIIIES